VKLVSFKTGERDSFGIWTDAGIVDLGRRLQPEIATLQDLVEKDALAKARAFETAPPDLAHGDVCLDKPLLGWGKCFCVGVNYPDRNEEYKDRSGAPEHPSLFVRFPESFVGPDAAILRPPESPQLDYEGEVVLVIGKRGRRIPPAEWRDHVFGYTIGNEGTIRDWLRHGKFNVTQGKNFARSGSLGPWLVPKEDLPESPMRITTRVNGEIRQNDTTDRMIFSFGRILEYVSTFCTLEPGDIIFTGTPTGAGARFDPPRWLAPGDRLEIEVSGLGTLRNPIVDER
jgi:2-keto-4-pentenoate hydratase/2-oxohepta-3-ene-1,7-dioic acid hydratase in catechol pathway